ncbi:Las1-like-domain-containing protein [Chiua virens]|nr:Las1-like-domain-containing protein [Chiua virens]
MRLPRRVPWAHISELEQVCSWIYTDEEDLEAKTLAINRLSTWKAVTPLPHALDSALALLAARVLDVACRDILSTGTALSLRQSYGTAIIRMVNGLVDPLQTGIYARSIAAIATQLGLPSWLVELRHAATHEDLPSLELLREAASESYKLLMKTVTRDGSLRKRYQDKIDAVIRDIERWITEAKVSMELAANPLGWGFDDNSDAAREKWVLESFCDTLFERGAIVPVSKRKCRAPADPLFPTTPSLALWTPLLAQLRATHTIFPFVFVGRIISTLLDDLTSSNEEMHVIELDARIYLGTEFTMKVDLRKEIILQVAPIFIPGRSSGPKAKILNELLQSIAVGSKGLEESVELLTRKCATAAVPIQPWKAHDLVEMEERLQFLMVNEIRSGLSGNSATVMDGATRPGGILAPGWRLLDDCSDWTPMPDRYLVQAMKLNSPLPQTLPKECQKAAKIFSSFVDSKHNGLDGIIPRNVLEHAKGFAIFTVFKAGFLFSARGGTGIVIARLPNGSWSAPSAIGTGGVGVGGQVGAEMTDFLIVLNSAATSFMSAGSLTLGGNMSVAVGPLGRNGEAIGSLNSSGKVAAMYSYSKTRGLFGGVSIEGSVIVERQDANVLAYHKDVTVRMLLSGAVPCPTWADPLVQALESCTSGHGVRRWIDDRADGQTLYAFGSSNEMGATVSQPQQSSGFLRKKKKKHTEFPPRHWGTQTSSGSYFSDDVNRPHWEDVNEPSRSAGFDDEFDSGSSSAQKTHRPSRSVGALTSIPVDSYDPASPFNSLPPFDSVRSTLSDTTASHSRSMSAPKLKYPEELRDNLAGYSDPFFPNPPPPEYDHEYDHDTVESPPPHFKTKPELSKPLSPHEGVARAIALYEFKAVEAGDLSFSRGDVIIVTRKSDSTDDWWKGKLDGKEGIFPANFVEIV